MAPVNIFSQFQTSLLELMAVDLVAPVLLPATQLSTSEQVTTLWELRYDTKY